MTDQWNELNLRMERAFQNQRLASEARSLRDHFAAAALTGLLASGMDSVDEMPTRAYRMADAMLRERGNRQAALDSSTLTDAEREAVERAADWLDRWQQTHGYHSSESGDLATLRNLLERTK